MKHRAVMLSAGEVASVEASKPAVQTIEKAVGLLLPHAVSHVFTPPSTPIRWREKHIQGETEPHAFSLRMKLDPESRRRVDWTVALRRDRGDTGLWTCTVTEPALGGDPDTTKNSTSLKVFDSRVGVEKRVLRKIPEFPDTGPVTIGGEWDFSLSDERRAELIEYVVDAVGYAIVELPSQQAEFIKERPDINFDERLFETIASPISRNVLAPLLDTVTYFRQIVPSQG